MAVLNSSLSFDQDYRSYSASILATYNYYIRNTTATFYTTQIGAEELEQMLCKENGIYVTRAVLFGGVYAGYCRLSPFNKREAYARTAEVTLYLDPPFCGRGLGRLIVSFLEDLAVNHRLHTLVACISGENSTSIALFEKCGYKKCGHIAEAGYKFERFIDTVYYQKMLP